MAAAINALTPTAGAPKAASATPDIFGGMGPDAFLKLLVAQLRYQNPMNPSDPTAMMGQVAQFAQVEALTKMQQGQATDQSLSEARMATDMVGKIVSASDGKTNETGKVMSARFTSTGPVLVLDNGAEVTLSAVVTVTDRAASPVISPPVVPAVAPAAISPDPVATAPVTPVSAAPDPSSPTP